MNSIKFDNFATKKDSITLCEVIVTGLLKRPQMPSLAPYVIMPLKEDKSNEAACTALLTEPEVKPVVP